MEQVTKGRVHFAINQYPKFGRGPYSISSPPSTVTNSPFYWWFNFLRLNEGYKATAEANGIGICAEQYADFGDIYTVDFKEWWLKQGHARLFAEKPSSYTMKIAKNESDLAEFNSDEALNVVIPLTWTRTDIERRFAELVLKKIDKANKGLNTDESTAKYKINGKWHCEAMATAHKVYLLRKENEQAVKAGRATKLAWADLAIRANLNASKGLIEGKKGNMVSDDRRTLTVMAIRHYKRAAAYIKAAATHSFPRLYTVT